MSGAEPCTGSYSSTLPPTLAEADPGGFNPGDRVTRLDEYGIDKQILYPNLLGFFASCFVNMNQPEAMKAVIRDRLRRRLSAPRRIGCPYHLTALSSAPGFDAAAWLPGDVMARFFHTA